MQSEVRVLRSVLATEELDINAPPDVLAVLDDGVDRKIRRFSSLMKLERFHYTQITQSLGLI